MRASQQEDFSGCSGGFSLLEFLLAVALISIITVLAVGGMQQMHARMQMNTNINNLLHAIHEARSRALTNGTEVVICPSRDASRCDASNNWQAGWLAFQTRVAGRRQPAAGDITLIRGASMKGLRVSANRQAFVLRPFGRRSTNGTWVFCDSRSLVAARAVIVSFTGKPRVSSTSAAGRPLFCPDT